ncbi:NUDIX hydrolase [Corynebacterium suranareeae]|uniref:NUDIX hydrolase n=1 Tax=Corynebacterium suranareeae TaxID=2506452 RepID=UPI001E5E78DF|nr:NUDIX domain-containing protein [Corynebacterium suranareeae]
MKPSELEPSEPIRIAAVVIYNQHRQVLSVRKTGTSAFMLPGGKLEPGETPQAAAIREISEELHFDLKEEEVDFLGHFEAPAANEPGFFVDCHVFTAVDLTLNDTPEVFEELAEAAFFPLDSTSPKLAPLSKDVFAVLAGT